jgi:hypothetical protein
LPIRIYIVDSNCIYIVVYSMAATYNGMVYPYPLTHPHKRKLT